MARAVLAAFVVGAVLVVGSSALVMVGFAGSWRLAATEVIGFIGLLTFQRSRVLFLTFDPLMCWLRARRRKLFFVRGVWVVQEEAPYGWAIHQASSPFVRASKGRRFTAFAELRAVAGALRDGSFAQIATVVVPCGSVQPTHLKRLGFAIVQRRRRWVRRFGFALAADEYRYRAQLTRTSRVATFNPYAGTMPRAEFVRRFAGPSEPR